MFLRPKFLVVQITFRYLACFSSKVLLGEPNKLKCVKNFKKIIPKKSETEESRTAGVLIPLCLHNGEVSLLFTLRASNLTTHRGQVSFPGGMKDDKDSSLEDTALRETHEELGILPQEVELWGSGNPIITKQNMGILPVIGVLKEDLSKKKLILNESEVDEVFTVTIKNLCTPAYHGYTQFRNTYTTPVFYGQHRIWGLTAIITHLFLKSFLPQTLYKHSIPYIRNVITQSR